MRGIGKDMVTAIHPDIRITESGIDQRAMMGSRGIVMMMRAEELAGNAHALDRDRAGILQAAYEGHQCVEESPLPGGRKRGHRIGNRSSGGLCQPMESDARLGDVNAACPPVPFPGHLGDKAFSLQGKDCIGRGGLRHQEVTCNLSHAQTGRPALQQTKHGALRGRETSLLRAGAVIRTQRGRKPGKALADAVI